MNDYLTRTIAHYVEEWELDSDQADEAEERLRSRDDLDDAIDNEDFNKAQKIIEDVINQVTEETKKILKK